MAKHQLLALYKVATLDKRNFLSERYGRISRLYFCLLKTSGQKMNEYNLLKLKSDLGKMYVFDALTNDIFSIENDEDFNSVCMADFGHDTDLRLHPLEFSEIQKEVSANAKTLILEITEECNLRCTYCVFDEKHIFERNHSNKTMPLELAFEEVKNFYNRTNQEEGYIVFYGGEPLLAFDMIKQIVDYANQISNRRLKFSLTTNGLALSENKFDFLIENNFLITVSLDGDKETHDKQRVTVTGKGTFDAITNNLKKLKNYNPQFLKNNVLINCVISDANDLSKINQFFKDNNFAEESLRFSPVLQNNVAIDSYITNSISLESVKQSLNAGLLPVENHFLDSILKKIEFRKLDDDARLGKKLCVPFANRTYVRADGSIQFCERIENYGKSKNESTNLAAKSETIYSEFKTFKQETCSKCFAYNFCEMCPASFIKNSQFDNELANAKCGQYRQTVKQALQIYINKMECEEVEQC